MKQLILLDGFFGRGVYGQKEVIIETKDEVDLTQPIIRVKGRIAFYDDYPNNPLHGERIFEIPKEKIIFVTIEAK